MEIVLAPRVKLTLRSAIIAASGTFGYGTEFASRTSLDGLGAVISKGTTLEPRTGNPPLRMVETAAGMINAIGLQNIGVEAVIREKAPIWAGWNTPVFVNICGSTVDEYVELARSLDGVPGVAGLELNISCPNVKAGGAQFGSDPFMAAAVTRSVRHATDLPLMVKLSPNVTDVVPIAQAVEEAGADVISLINTVQGLAVDLDHRRPSIANVSGGLSGPAIKPIALYCVYRVAEAVSVPIVGLGGIMNGSDAVEFLMAGATAIGVATLLLIDPAGWRVVEREVENWCRAHHMKNMSEIVGAANVHFAQKTGERQLTGS